MEQFSLEKWLQDKSRKVVTRRGNLVMIICTDRKYGEDNLPIVFLEQCHNGEFLRACRKDGRGDTYDTPYDLFFADEKEELTEFEKVVQSMLNEPHFQDIEAVKQFSKTLLDLARKEIRKEQQEKLGTLEMPIDIAENSVGERTKNHPANLLHIICVKDACIEMAQWKDEQFKEQLINLKDEIQNNLCASSGFNDEYSLGYQDCGMKVMEMIDKILNK